MQLYSVDQAKSQPLEAHAAAFSYVKVSFLVDCTQEDDRHCGVSWV